MTGKAIQIQALFPCQKTSRSKQQCWTVVYPPQPHPSDANSIFRDNDIPSWIKRKTDLHGMMKSNIPPGYSWRPTRFKVFWMRGGRGHGIRKIWQGRVFPDGRVEPNHKLDKLGDPPFNLI